MGVYAASLSQLLRRCYQDKIDPIMLTDGDFADYINELREEKSPTSPSEPKRTEDTISAIGRVWLDFLGVVGRLHGFESFVAPEGRIRATEETYHYYDKLGRKRSSTYLSHHSFGPPARAKKRNPITAEQISLLKDAARKDDTSLFVKVRRSLLIDLLTDTGARRSELEQLTTDDIKAAKKLKNPTLRLTTLKQHGELSFREVPILPTLLHHLNNYVERQRSDIMKKKYKDGKDHRRFFVSERSGRPLSSKYLYNEIKKLKVASGIETPIFPHMFRHRFITKLFIDLIRTHQVTNEDDFRRNLLNTEIFKIHVTQWTGHLDPESINAYLHLALAASADYAETVNSVHMQRAMEAYFERQAELTRRLKEGLPVEEYTKELNLLKELVQKDFEVARVREATTNTKHL
ncbi:tyrosine-type recombinase/integrase [Pseudomonas alloputida]|uniref:tyrosine-type recombinase/integrase n=1 Tax=Pseudomonas alloputida TaxID=1940621 RepID=UPI003B43685A